VALDSPLFLLGALCVGLLFTFFCRLLSMATGHNLIFPPRTMRLLSVILLIQSGLQSAIGVTIQGILTCNLYANQTISIDVLLHSPNYKGGQAVLWQIDGNDKLLIKIPRRQNDANPWLQPLHSPPSANATFLNRFVPSSHACQLETDLWSQQKTVLVKAKVNDGFDCDNLPVDSPHPFRLRLYQKLQIFFRQLVAYEMNEPNHSLFDVSPSNVMYGRIKDGNKKALANLFHGNDSTSTEAPLDDGMHIWLVDFTLFRPNHRSNQKRRRNGKRRNEKRTAHLWKLFRENLLPQRSDFVLLPVPKSID